MPISINYNSIPQQESAGIKEIPDGRYDAIVDKCELRTTMGGMNYIDISLIVLDTEDKPIGRQWLKVFDNPAKGGIDAVAIARIAKACQVPDGTEIEGFTGEAFDKVFKGRVLEVDLRHGKGEYAKYQNAWANGIAKHAKPILDFGGGASASGGVEVADDDMPF